MSGIYIPDVSLPGDGDFELWIAIKKDGSFTYNVSGGWHNGKNKAITVHDHGRRVDGDRLLSERMKRAYYHLPNGDTAIPIVDIEHAPTIIPAEPPKEETC